MSSRDVQDDAMMMLLEAASLSFFFRDILFKKFTAKWQSQAFTQQKPPTP